jgi:predicted amidohydrolase YtcJ
MITSIPLSIWSHANELNTEFSGGAYEHLPVFLLGSDGHTGWANSLLRMRAGLTKEFILQLPGDERKNYGLTADLEPNGFGVDSGLAKIVAAVPRPCWL